MFMSFLPFYYLSLYSSQTRPHSGPRSNANPFVTLLAWRVATHHPKGWAMRHWTAWMCLESHVGERAVRVRADE